MARQSTADSGEPGRTLALALLSFAAGTMDTLTFLLLGEIFTSAMSGNTIILGLALGQGGMATASKAGTAVGGFVLGVIVATPQLRWPKRGVILVLVAETALLGIFAGLWALHGGPTTSPVLYALIGLSSFAMGMQGAIGRHLRLPGVATIVFTGTLTAIVGGTVERLCARERPLVPPSVWRQIAMYAAYLASALATGFAALRWTPALPYVPLAVVALTTFGVGVGLLRLQDR